ncbi:hypothetical protein [Mycobacteroides chelonae]|uniref:hypothetical protein n=1 Tax=Mycobacteroides chelonae TaxID=1774 RepID=UPI0012FFB2C8|nr:hypothetical protein [Mycobacteroides chelonae]
MPWVEDAPVTCPACGERYRDHRTLVGWDNLHRPRSCRTYRCGACGHTLHVEHTTLREVPERPRRRRT